MSNDGGAAGETPAVVRSGNALGKAFMSIGKPTLYEQLQDDEETAMLEQTRARRRAVTAAQAHEAATIVDEAEIHRSLWKRALEDLVPDMVDTQREVAQRYIDEWAQYARSDAREWVERARGQEPAADPDQDVAPEPGQLVTATSRNGTTPSLDSPA